MTKQLLSLASASLLCLTLGACDKQEAKKDDDKKADAKKDDAKKDEKKEAAGEEKKEGGW